MGEKPRRHVRVADPRVVRRRVGGGLAANLDPVVHVGPVAAVVKIGNEWGKLGRRDEHRDAGILQNELKLIGNEPEVQGNVDGTNFRNGENPLAMRRS